MCCRNVHLFYTTSVSQAMATMSERTHVPRSAITILIKIVLVIIITIIMSVFPPINSMIHPSFSLIIATIMTIFPEWSEDWVVRKLWSTASPWRRKTNQRTLLLVEALTPQWGYVGQITTILIVQKVLYTSPPRYLQSIQPLYSPRHYIHLRGALTKNTGLFGNFSQHGGGGAP